MRLLRLYLGVLMLAPLFAAALAASPAAASATAAVSKDSPFGIVANLGNRVRSDEQPTMVSLMREAGVQWAREEISWDRLQLERGGAYRWGGDAEGLYNYDQAISLQREAGIQVLGLLAYNPAWFKSKNPVLEEWLGDWGDYVYSVVARYGRDRGQIRYWEVWNEPNLRPFGYEHGLYTVQDFVRVLDVARAAIKAADPGAVIVLGGMYDIWGQPATPEDYDSLDYLRMLHEAGGWNSFDILSLHPYRPGAPEAALHRRGPDMTMRDELRVLDGMMAEFGQKPIWFTEVGWSSFTGIFGVTEAEQAAYLQRMYAIALSHPSVEKVFWYDLRDDTAPQAPYTQPVENVAESEFHYGLLRRRFPLNPDDPSLRKPAFVAYRALTDALAGMQLETVVADGTHPGLRGVYWYRFRDGARRADILWRLYGDPVDIEIPCDCREARVRQWDGRLIRVTSTDSGYVVGRLEEIGQPIIVETGPDKVQHGTFYAETAHYLGGGFARYWRDNGGLAQFGYPITGEIVEPDPRTGKARVVQYFERNRFDYFPELAGSAYVVQLGRLGDVALRRNGIAWETLPRRGAADQPCLFFAETGQQICPPFRDRWEKAGGLARHGLPLTDAHEENGHLVQYFERSRFEHHPDNPPEYQVLLGLLSRELYGSWARWR